MRAKTMRIADTVFLVLFIVMTLVESFVLHNYSDVVVNLLIIVLFMRIIKFEKDLEDDERNDR